MNSKLRVRILQSAAVATPVVAIIIFKLASGGTPAPSNAAAEPAPTATQSTAVAPAPTPDQKRALEWAAKQDPNAPVASPLTPPEARAQTPTTPTTAPAAPRVVGVEYNLTSILKARDSAIAAINGKLYRVGDQVKPGATLVAIDTVKFTARIQRNDGSVVDLTCDTAQPRAPKRAPAKPAPAAPAQTPTQGT